MSEVVRYEVVDRVAIVTIDRPDVRNAMSMEVFHGLRDRAAQADADDEVGAVLVRGAGGAFSSGIDVAVLGDQVETGVDLEFIAGLQASFTAFEDLDKPSIAAVEGYCFGAGIQLALACHLRAVTPDAQLSVLETRWGLVPDLGGTVRLPRLVGLGRATELCMTARRVSGEEALAMGLAEVRLSADDPQTDAMTFARRLANGPGAVRRIPGLLRANLDAPRAEALRREAETQVTCIEGPDFTEAVLAARQDREPVFQGR